MATFDVRRVVTGHRDGRAVFLSDGTPPNTVSVPDGFGVSELLWLDGAPAGADAGGDRDGGGYPLEPPAGGLSARVIRMPANGTWLRVAGDDDAAPGMHATDTLDLMLVLHGAIRLGLDDTEVTVSAREAVIQRGTRHRWQVVGEEACTYLVVMLRPDPARPTVTGGWSAGDSGVRRVVTDGASALVGEAPVGVRAGGFSMAELWQTLGPLASARQGGDASGPWQLEPAGGGVAFRSFTLAPPDNDHDTDPEAGWHVTGTIDIDVVLEGRVALDLPDLPPAELGAGDVVIQRGTNHRWRPLGGEPVHMAAVMIAVPN